MKTIIVTLILLTQTWAYASGCDSRREGLPNIQRTVTVKTAYYTLDDGRFDCRQLPLYSDLYCRIEFVLDGKTFVFGKEVTFNDSFWEGVISYNIFHDIIDATYYNQWKIIYYEENIFGSFHDSCNEADYKALKSGRYRIEIVENHAPNGKIIELVYPARLEHDKQLPLF